MANSFSQDAACKALYRYESGARLSDSQGSNTLEEKGDNGYDTQEATGAGQYQEGSAAIKTIYNASGYYGFPGIDDADLDSGFPLKNGDTTKKISIAGWFYLYENNAGGSVYIDILEKANSIKLSTMLSDGRYGLRVYHSGGNQLITAAAGIELNKWYHFGLAIDGIAKTYLIRHYDKTADQATTFSGSFTNELLVGTGVLRFARYLAAYLDEYVIFNDVKTADDFDSIRSATYAPGGSSLLDGKIRIKSASTNLLDGKVAAGATINKLDGKALVQGGGTNMLDGALLVNTPTDALDGKAELIARATNLLDGALPVNTPTDALDGKAKIITAASGLFDGLVELPEFIATENWAWSGIAPAAQWILPQATPRREIFTATLVKTGYADYEMPMKSMQLMRRDGQPTLVSCVVPDAQTYIDAATGREGGELVIHAGVLLADGTRQLAELERAALDSIAYDRGVQNSSLTLSGYKTETNANPRPVDIEKVTYTAMQANGKKKVRGKVNIFLRPGDTLIYGLDSFTVEQIYIYVIHNNSWMEASGI